MPELPSGYAGGGRVTASSFSGSDSLGSVTVTSDVSLNTKGAWAELIASTEHDANWIEIEMTDSTSTEFGLVDVGIGSSTEQVIIPDLVFGSRSIGGSYPSYLIPVFIPKGSRLSARWQTAESAVTLAVGVRLIGGTLLAGGSGPSVVSSYGSTTGSDGTNIDPGGTANTWSAWTEITSATDRDHRWLVCATQFGDGGITGTSWRLQIGIGSSTEQVLIPDMAFSADAFADRPFNAVRTFPVFIPKGSRLTVRARASVTTDGDRDVWVRLYGAG